MHIKECPKKMVKKSCIDIDFRVWEVGEPWVVVLFLQGHAF